MKTRGFCLTIAAIFLVVVLETAFVLGQEPGKPLTRADGSGKAGIYEAAANTLKYRFLPGESRN